MKKILCFIVLLFSLAVPAFADDVEPFVIAPDGSGWDSSILWDGVKKSYPALPDTFLGSNEYDYVVWKNDSGDYFCILLGDYGSTWVSNDSNGNLSIFCPGKNSAGTRWQQLYEYIDGSWVSRSDYNLVLAYSNGLHGTILDCSFNVRYADGVNGSVFFSQAVVPTPTPTPIPPKPLAEVVQQMQGEQIQVSLIPSLTGSLGVLVPFGIGLLALLVGSVILPKVLRKFL